MNQRIIYPFEDRVALITPTGELALEEVARKDVPAGIPYRIVDEADLPPDYSEFDRWTADFSNPDGFGIGAEAWFAEQAAKEEITEEETE